jgi:hypothetical protein
VTAVVFLAWLSVLVPLTRLHAQVPAAQVPAAKGLATRAKPIAQATPTPRTGAVRRGVASPSDARRHASDRIDLRAARPVGGRLRKAGYLEQAAVGFAGYAEPSCGCETVCDCPAGLTPLPPSRGLEARCGLEAACGVEAGCGVETGFASALGSGAVCGCGDATCDGLGCDSYCDGMDPDCTCNVCTGGLRGFLDGVFPRLRVHWDRFDLFAGVDGFTGPMNFANLSDDGVRRSGTGSFGFYEGFNRGFSLKFFGTDLAYQSGVRFLQSNLSGAGFSDETRSQIFLTSGLFRRVDYGLQYGTVVDYLYEDWYFRGDLIQLRGELSWVTRQAHVFGLKYAVGVDDDSALTSVTDQSGAVIRNQVEFEAMTQYRLFYRQRLDRLGSLEGFVGWTDNDDGLLGLDLDLPVAGRLLWNTSATYLIPNEGSQSGGNVQEGWNLMIGFTFRPGGLGAGSRYTRPLLKVADNGTMMMDRK